VNDGVRETVNDGVRDGVRDGVNDGVRDGVADPAEASYENHSSLEAFVPSVAPFIA
jgi:hypothetical protein